MQTIAERLQTAHDAIEKAAKLAHRDSHSVQLLAVSKTKPVSDIRLAYESGQKIFGENYIQEGVDKIQQLAMLSDIEWHMIGPIQSNKTKLVAEYFDWVQSIDRYKIAQRLNDQRPASMSPLNICVQVNIDNEETKSGVTTDCLGELLTQVASLPNLKLRGLMAIPKANPDKAQQEATFSDLFALYTQYKTHFQYFDTLSLGMSQDMDTAIKYGSTMVRIGTAIFGERASKMGNE